MQINNALSAYRANVPAAAPQRPATAAPAAKKAESADSASFQASAVQQALADTPVVNREKVDAIKAAIANGAFSINPEKIADGLLKSAAERIATRA